MRERRPETRTMKISDVRGQLNTLVNRVYREETRIVVEKSGIPVAGLVSAADLERLDQWDKQRDADFSVIEELRDAFREVPEEEIQRETDRALAKARASRRAERERTAAQS